MICIRSGMKEASRAEKKSFVYFYSMNASIIAYEPPKKYCNVFIYTFDHSYQNYPYQAGNST